MALDMPQYSES